MNAQRTFPKSTPSPIVSLHVSPSIVYLALWIACLAIFLAFPSQQYDPDPLGELAYIRQLSAAYDSPAHMLYVQVGVPAYRLWLSLGGTADPLRVMQIINALTGAAAITFFALILGQTGIRAAVALALSVAAGLSYAFWTHTEDAFFIIPAACFALLAWWCALRLASHENRRWITLLALIVSLTLAVLFYQTNLLIIPALWVASWNHQQRARWLREWLLVSLAVGALAGGAWWWQGTQLAGTQTAADTLTWFLTGHGGLLSGLWRREGVDLVVPTLTALAATILPVYEGMHLRALLQGQPDLQHLPAQLALAALGLTLLYSLLILWRARGERPLALPGRVWLAAALWFGLPGLAVIWFDRAEVKLWLIPMFAFWLALAAVLNTGLKWRGWRTLTAVLLVALPVLIGTGNFALAIWPQAATPSSALAKARMTLNHLTPDDVILTASFDWTAQLQYLCPTCQVVNALDLAQRVSQENRQQIKETLWSLVRKTWAAGHHAYAMQYLMQPDQAIWQTWVTPYTGLVGADFAQFDHQIAWQFPDGEIVWEIMPPA